MSLSFVQFFDLAVYQSSKAMVEKKINSVAACNYNLNLYAVTVTSL